MNADDTRREYLRHADDPRRGDDVAFWVFIGFLLFIALILIGFLVAIFAAMFAVFFGGR